MKNIADPGPFCEMLAYVAAIIVGVVVVLVAIELYRANYNPADGEQWWVHVWPMSERVK